MGTYAATLPLRPFKPFEDDSPERKPTPPRRRITPEQGRALECLGHAIEYLVDSRLFDQWETAADAEAVHLLMACSQAIYNGGQEAVPWHQRVQRRLMNRRNSPSAVTRH